MRSRIVPEIDYRDIKKNLHALVNLIPNNEFYKYNDLWSRTTQQAVFLITFASYLNKREIVDIVPAVEEILEGNKDEFGICVFFSRSLFC